MKGAPRKSLEPLVNATPEQIAWCAGLFEGEGCFSTSGYDPYIYFLMTMKMTDEDVIRKFHEIVTVGKVRRHHPPSNKDRQVQWHWYVGSAAAENLGWMLLPHLGNRRRARFIEVLEAVRARRTA